MPQQFPSIQSFFQPEMSPSKKENVSGPAAAAGDGFTAQEVETTLHRPSLPTWHPRGTYEEIDIKTLMPGPGCVTIMGRVVNFFQLQTPSKAPHAAKGCLKLVVKDDTGALVVGFPFTMPIKRCLTHLARFGYGMIRLTTVSASVSWSLSGHPTSRARNPML